MLRSQSLAALISACLCVACAGEQAMESQRRLAAGFVPKDPSSKLSLAALGPVSLVSSGPDLWLRTELGPGAWKRAGRPGVWRQARLARGAGRPSSGPAQRLLPMDADLSGRAADDPYRFLPIDTSRPDFGKIVPGVFCAVGEQVYVARESGTGPPPEPIALLEAFELGHDDGVAWRVAVGTIEAEGFPLLEGIDESFLLRPHSREIAFSFWTTARPLAPLVSASGSTGEVVFRIHLDDKQIFQSSLRLGNDTTNRAHSLRLPATSDPLRLTFSMEGDLALGAIHQPRLHSVEFGQRGARPWGEARPDLTLIVADTYRADNMEAYGGDARIAPELNALAARARVYTQAWATSSWTLPSHASLFSGLLPPAAGCMDFADRLGPGAQTLAEVLRGEGYRTVAITDRGFVSRDHGLSQGFEWFEEVMRRGEGSLEQTIENVRAQLSVDDGRPLFLFVQTYRAHTPYEISSETRAELAQFLDEPGSYEELLEEFPLGDMGPSHERYGEFLLRLGKLYRGAARDTSRGLGRLVEQLEQAQMLRNGHLILTSDHGESLGEQALWGHGSSVFESQLRIPILHLGVNVQPEQIVSSVSLLDIPSTLVGLAGLAAPMDWQGEDLRQTHSPRTLFAFVGDQQTGGDRGAFAARQGSHKLYFLDSAEDHDPRAFDLASDQAEATDIFAGAQWAAPFAQQVRLSLPALRAVRFGSTDVQLSAEAQNQLNELGYGGEE